MGTSGDFWACLLWRAARGEWEKRFYSCLYSTARPSPWWSHCRTAMLRRSRSSATRVGSWTNASKSFAKRPSTCRIRSRRSAAALRHVVENVENYSWVISNNFAETTKKWTVEKQWVCQCFKCRSGHVSKHWSGLRQRRLTIRSRRYVGCNFEWLLKWLQENQPGDE